MGNRYENEIPKSVDSLVDPEFADLLAGLAESHHLDRLMDSAFVGDNVADLVRSWYRSCITEDSSLDTMSAIPSRLRAVPRLLHKRSRAIHMRLESTYIMPLFFVN